MLGQSVRLHSSGRTDAGVHALGMVAVFKTEKELPVRAFSDGLNCLLPSDIAVRDAAEVPLSFNPRADAVSKHYRYTIYNGKRRSPLTRLTSWHLRGVLDMESMQQLPPILSASMILLPSALPIALQKPPSGDCFMSRLSKSATLSLLMCMAPGFSKIWCELLPERWWQWDGGNCTQALFPCCLPKETGLHPASLPRRRDFVSSKSFIEFLEISRKNFS